MSYDTPLRVIGLNDIACPLRKDTVLMKEGVNQLVIAPLLYRPTRRSWLVTSTVGDISVIATKTDHIWMEVRPT